jgi:hypothetical protein
MTLKQVYTILNKTIGQVDPDTYLKLSEAIAKHSTTSFQEGADMVKQVYNIK